MSPKKTIEWIVPAILIGLVAAGGLVAWASPPDATGEVDMASAGPVEPDPGPGATTVALLPVPVPRQPDQRTGFDARLIGTAVVGRGPSIAVLQLTTGSRYVREGDEIVAGIRLVKVWRDRIDVERNGVHEEIRIGSNQGVGQQVLSGSNPAGSGSEARARLREDLKARGRL
jgi:hypothetical protein